MPEHAQPLRNLVLSNAELDRDAASREPRGFLPGLLADDATEVLEMHGDRAQVDGDSLVLRAPNEADREWYESRGVTLYCGQQGSRRVVAILRPAVDKDEVPADEKWSGLRQVGMRLDPFDLAVLTTATAMVHWHANHGHCPRCGAETLPRQAGWVRVCSYDGSQHFPRTDPAVIMAIVDDDDRILLARGPRWGGPFRSVLAGFVEPGESFEAAVRRETAEESGVIVDDVTYVGNQPWPFPASLMIGYIGHATTTELTPQEGEIEKLGWYTRQDVENGLATGDLALPSRLSIARSLIERWYGSELADPNDPHDAGSAPQPDGSKGAK